MALTIGEQLEQARKERGVSIEEAASATRIRPHYLKALEADDASSLPSAVQGRGFLRNYASYLGLDFAALTAARKPDAPGQEYPQELPKASEVPEPELEAAPAVPLPAAQLQAPLPAFKARTNGHLPTRPASVVLSEREPTPAPTPHTDDIFKEIGSQLADQRERLSLPLSDIERYTHIRLHYLKAMEAGEFEQLPSFTQARGMLNHYARFLSLDTERILTRFAEALLTRREEILGPTPGTKTKTPLQTAGRLRRFLTMDAIVGSGLIILLVIFIVWGASRVFNLREPAGVESTPPSVAEMLLSSPESAGSLLLDATLTPTAEPDSAANPAATLQPESAAQGAALPPPEPGKVQVFVVGITRAWMQVIVDGKTAFTGRVVPGGAYPFTGDSQIELITANGGAIQVFLNQNDLGTPGAWNEVVRLVYTSEGALLPTPTVTPTPTRTPRVSPTPTLTTTILPGGE